MKPAQKKELKALGAMIKLLDPFTTDQRDRLLRGMMIAIAVDLPPAVTAQRDPTKEELGQRILVLERQSEILSTDIAGRERLHYALADYVKRHLRKDTLCPSCHRAPVNERDTAIPHTPECRICLPSGDVRMPPNYPPEGT